MAWSQNQLSGAFESGREEWVLIRYPAGESDLITEGQKLPRDIIPLIEVLSCSTNAFCDFIQKNVKEDGVFPDMGVNSVTSRFVKGHSEYRLILQAPPGSHPIRVPLKLSLGKEAISTLANLKHSPDDNLYVLIRTVLDPTGHPATTEPIYVDSALTSLAETVGKSLTIDWDGYRPHRMVLFILVTVSAGKVYPLNWIGYVP